MPNEIPSVTCVRGLSGADVGDCCRGRVDLAQGGFGADACPACSNFVKVFRYEEKPHYDAPTLEQRAQTRQGGNEMRLKLESEFPVLKVDEHPVPEDKNGFLQLYLLSPPPHYPDLCLSHEFRQMLNGKSD